MSIIWLRLLALMALVFSFTPAQAGMCNKHNPNWNPETKTCPEKPVALKKREPERAEPPQSRRVTEVFIPPAAASAPAPVIKTSSPSQLMQGVSTPSVIRSPGLPPLTVAACGQVVSVGGTIGTYFISPTTPVQSFGRIDN